MLSVYLVTGVLLGWKIAMIVIGTWIVWLLWLQLFKVVDWVQAVTPMSSSVTLPTTSETKPSGIPDWG